jgi:hypothetical protein
VIHVTMETEKTHALPSASWRSNKTWGIIWRFECCRSDSIDSRLHLEPQNQERGEQEKILVLVQAVNRLADSHLYWGGHCFTQFSIQMLENPSDTFPKSVLQDIYAFWDPVRLKHKIKCHRHEFNSYSEAVILASVREHVCSCHFNDVYKEYVQLYACKNLSNFKNT